MPSASQPPSGRPGSARPSRLRRPTGPTLDAIERDGISWDGEVAIIGHGGEIPAYLFVTSDRCVLASGDTVLLEAPRAWLVPAPLRVDETGIRLSITPEGVVPGRDTTERLLLMVRDGRGPANQLAAILTGRARRQKIEAELPTWKNGAGRSSSLPPLPAFESAQDQPRRDTRATGDAETRGVAPIDAWTRPEAEARAAAPATFLAPEPAPVEPQSRAARFLTSRVEAPAAPRQPRETRPATVTPIAEEREKRRRAAGAWLGWAAMLVLIALAAGWFARPYLPDDVTDRLPAAIVGDQGDDGDVALQERDAPQPASSDANQGDGTTGAGTNPTDIMPTEVALGVGGATSDVPAGGGEHGPEGSVLPTPTPSGTGGTTGDGPEATGNESLPGDLAQATIDETQPAETGEQSGDPGETQPQSTETPVVIAPTTAPVIEPTLAPTEVPVEETPAPTQAPTEIATEAPTVAPTEEPTIAPTEAPTEVVTEAPVEQPATPTAAATESPEPTIAPTDAAPSEPTLESQPASVNPEEPPAQEFVQSGIRYSVDGATAGSSVPELPEINAVTYGEWIVLSVSGENQTGDNQVFDMREFTLIADGAPIQVDVGNSWVASMLGYTPAYGNTDAILWAPGEQHQFALTFLAPPDAQSLVLQAGDQQLDLSGILDTTPGLGQMQQTAAPETIEATVVEVIDGETIAIEKDGIRQTVRYLGIDVPTGDACYAAEATDANTALVEGKTVKIERQATDVDAQGNWVRDVWVAQDDGRYALVAHQLVREGAATADISQPNTRFATWLRAADAAAHAEGLGLWGSCGQGSAPADAPVVMQPDGHAWRSDA